MIMVITALCSFQKLCLHKKYTDVHLYDMYAICGSQKVTCLILTNHYEIRQKGQEINEWISNFFISLN